jgi:hypothetical protein
MVPGMPHLREGGELAFRGWQMNEYQPVRPVTESGLCVLKNNEDFSLTSLF